MFDGCWSVGVLEFDEFDEFRRVGMLECWSVGVLECWSLMSFVSLMSLMSFIVLECWSVGVLEFDECGSWA